jgi:hypothetical protein
MGNAHAGSLRTYKQASMELISTTDMRIEEWIRQMERKHRRTPKPTPLL